MIELNIEILNKKTNGNELVFEIKGDNELGLPVSIINSLRRVLLSQIPTVAFRTERENNDINITINNTSLHNEYLAHRISLIPLYLNPENFTKNYLFELKVKNKDDASFLNITSADFNIYPIKDDVLQKAIVSDTLDSLDKISKENYQMDKPLNKKQKDEIFKPFEFKGQKNYCLITEFKSNNSSENVEEIELYGSPSVSIALENTKWQAVSCASYSYKKDDELFQNILKEKIRINNIEDKDIKKYANELYISESERYFNRDKNGNPNWFVFKLTSQHYLPSNKLFIQSNEIMKEILEEVNNEFDKFRKQEDSLINISNQKENIFKITIEGYDDTIGNIIQSFMTNYLINDTYIFNVCGYKKTHPLETKLLFTVSINPKNKIFTSKIEEKIYAICDAFIDVNNNLIQIFDNISKLI